MPCLRRFRCSLIANIEDLLLFDQTAICDSKSRLVEWFLLVEAVSVRCSHLIGVLVLLSPPAVTVPQLPVTFITRCESVRTRLHDELGTIFECHVWISAPPVRSVMNGWALEACSCCGSEVVFWLVVWSSVHHGPCTVTAACSVE